MGSATGAMKTAARRIGITLDEYLTRRNAGDKWCFDCARWLPVESFNAERSRGDGRDAKCTSCRAERHKRAYTPRERVSKRGARFVDARDGDKAQARGRVNVLVRSGVLRDPDTLPCTDCGHLVSSDGRKHDYDHHRGYAAEHHEDVQAVCRPCHRRREGRGA